VLTAPVAGDLSAVGGSIVAAGPVAGDELLLGGSVSSRAPIRGDFRAAGGNIAIMGPIMGDLVACGFSVHDTSHAGGSVFIVAANASVDNGASGPVTVYGNTVSLAGNFAGDVTVIASGSVTLAQDTKIQGKFSYEAPETAKIPASAIIIGGTTYTNASYLPNAGTSRTLALASIGIFLLVRILGALIIAGLLAGLFPDFAKVITDRAYTRRLRSIFLTALLGFAAFVATPILLLLLALTFVGIGIAFLLLIMYALLMFLSFIYAGILLGTICARYFTQREVVMWRDGVLGMFAFMLIALVPVVGWFFVLLLTIFTTGELLLLFFHVAFSQGEQTLEML
jgi:hypothetical protein